MIMKKLLTITLASTLTCISYAVSIHAHQGEWTNEPANSWVAVKKAFDTGSKYVEFDLCFTKSGEFICVHCDNSLKGQWHINNKKIADVTKEDIEQSRPKQKKYAERYPNMRISTLDDILRITPKDGCLIVDVRGFRKGYAEKFDEAVVRAGLKRENMYIPAGLIHHFRAISKEYVNAYYTIFLSKPSTEKNLTAEEIIKNAKNHKNKEFIRIISIGQAGYNLAGDYLKRINDKDYFRKFKKAGYLASAWTSNDPKMVKTLIEEYDIDIVYSDRADFIRKTLNIPAERKKR